MMVMVLVQIITFVGLAMVLHRFLMVTSLGETKRLQQLNEENAQKARELADRITDAEDEYREKLAKAEQEVKEMKAAAKKEIESLKEAMVSQGKAEADRIISQALGAKKEMRAEIEEEMKDRSTLFSYRMIQNILSADEQKAVHDGLVDSLLQELAGLERERLQTGGFRTGAEKRVDIKTAHPLSQGQKEKLEAVLSAQLEQKTVLQAVVDKEVIAGVVIMLDNLVVDGSLAERLRKAAETVRYGE
jgi:F0F1-type ATP synthase membrane subunit b/b'